MFVHNRIDAGALDNNDNIYNFHIASDADISDMETSNTSQPMRRKCHRQDTNIDDEACNATLPSKLHPNDLGNFFKLCSALKLLICQPIMAAQIEEADGLIHSYCLELLEVWPQYFWLGYLLITNTALWPFNHHHAVHIPECVQDYGPLTEFWTFLFERLNKVLKSY